MGFPIEVERENNYILLMEMYEAIKNAVENYQSWESIGKEAAYQIKQFEEKKM